MKTASDPRHQERQKIIQELFAWQAHNNQRISQKANSIVSNLAEVDKIISECAPEWNIDRINQIDLSILRLGVYDLVIEPITPAKVVIDESVELAKEFGSETSPSFINGALGKALRLEKRIKKLIATKLGAPENLLERDANLETDLNATSLEVNDLLTQIEKEYNLVFDKANQPKTVGDLIDAIEDQLD